MMQARAARIRQHLGVVITAGLLLAVAGPARAQQVRTDLYVTNGPVNAMAASGGTLYIGGAFTSVGPATGGALPLDPATGEPLALPQVAGTVYVVASDGAGGWYLGGKFTHVGGAGRENLAHLLPDRSLSSWNPGANGPVRALAVNGDSVLVGGEFTTIGGQAHAHLAVVSGATGLPFALWDPAPDGPVLALALADGVLYAGGNFTTIDSEPRSNIAALDAATGAATSWDPFADFSVFALAVRGFTVYVGGGFHNIGGLPRDYLAALNTSSGSALTFDPAPNDYVYALAVSATAVYAGGDFVDIGGQARVAVAALDPVTGSATSWDANLIPPGGPVLALALGADGLYVGGSFTTIAGGTRHNIAVLDTISASAAPWDPDLNQSVFSIGVTEEDVFVGGQFTSARAELRRNLAAIDLATGLVTPWNPDPNGQVDVVAIDGGLVYIGGLFNTVGGQPRLRLASVGAATGGVTGWNPAVDDRVRALVVNGGTAYVGGDFLNAGGQPRSHLAALSAATGLATSWDPGAGGSVYALALDGSTLYAGGTFIGLGGASRNYAGAVDTGTGLATGWNPDADGTVHTLLVSPAGRIFAGGSFAFIGGQMRNLVAVLDSITGNATLWDAGLTGTRVNALALNGSTLYLGGVFDELAGFGGFNLVAVSRTSGLPYAWDAKCPAVPDGSVISLAALGNHVYAGGSFNHMGGYPQSFIAGLDQVQSVSAVSPDHGGDQGGITLTITGIGFQAGSVPRLTRTGEAPINGLQTVVTPDGTGMTATFDLVGRALGPWDVMVANPDSSYSVLENGFTIESPTAQRLRVDVIGPPLIRANHPTSFDLVIQNLSNEDVLATPLWISRIPDGATVTLDFPAAPPPHAGDEPDWGLAPLTLDGTAGRFMALVIPRLPPGTTVRRITLTVPAEVTDFGLDAALAPPWADGLAFRNCLHDGEAIGNPSCVGPLLDALNAYMTSAMGPKWFNGVGLWAKVAWHCEGAASLASALAGAEQVLDYMLQPIEKTGLPSGCEVVLVPRWQTRRLIGVVTSVDPNDKVGPDGYGAEQEIGSGQIMPYSIRFENLDSASAPAQNVVVVDAINGDVLDSSTLTLGPITFGDRVVYPPPGLKSYTTDVDLRPGQDLIVRVAALFDEVTGVLSWSLGSIDPATGLPPTDPLAGFLPPNVNPPEGEGSVLFTVMPQPGLVGGEAISNSAAIIFDGGTPVETPAWTNLLDGTPPESQVLPLAPDQDSTVFTVTWEAPGPPPDLRDFSVYVSENDAEYRPWRIHTTATADTFAGRGGSVYAFYSLARDSSGNLEKIPAVADAETTTPVAVEGGPPLQLALHGAIPNPVVGDARVWFTLPDRAPAVLEVLDVTGRRIWERRVGTLGPGRHVVDVRAKSMRPGLYFVRLRRGGQTLVSRMVALR